MINVRFSASRPTVVPAKHSRSVSKWTHLTIRTIFRRQVSELNDCKSDSSVSHDQLLLSNTVFQSTTVSNMYDVKLHRPSEIFPNFCTPAPISYPPSSIHPLELTVPRRKNVTQRIFANHSGTNVPCTLSTVYFSSFCLFSKLL